MADKTFKSRIIHKHDTEANWNGLKAATFIPKRGEIIIYDIDSTHTYERFKIGDGEKTVIALPFADDTKVDKISGKGLSTNDYTTTEKNKLAGIDTGANKTIVDAEISKSSTNPVQNKVVKAYVDSLVGEETVQTQINDAIASKVDKVSGKGLSTNDYTTTEKNKLSGIASGAEVNQNAFSNIVVGSTTIAADGKTDTLTLSGSNVTLTPDATNDKVTIGITKDNVTAALGYTPPTTDTTYNAAGSSLGLVKSGGDVTISSGVITVNDDSHNHTIDNVDGLRAHIGDTAVATQISNAVSSKQNTITGAATTITDSNLTASRALISNSSGKVAVSAVTSTELGYLDGVTSAIQTQLDGKAASGHEHSAYVNQNAFGKVTVGSTTITADSATDTLTLVAGNNVTITPDATNDKVTIAATDTVYTHPSYTARTGVPTANATPGFGGTFQVSQPVSDATGHITAVNSRTITIPSAVATTSAAGLMSAADRSFLDKTEKELSNIDNRLRTVEETVEDHVSELVTPASIGALGNPLNDIVYDLDALLASGVHFGFYLTNASTVGTPYHGGLTGYASAVVMSYASSANNGMQIAFSSGTDKIFVRYLSGGSFGGWKSISTSAN